MSRRLFFFTLIAGAFIGVSVFASGVTSFIPASTGTNETSVFDESCFTEEEERFIDAENIHGYIGMCSEPFPAINQDNYFCFYQRGNGTVGIPFTWQYCGYTNCVTNATSAAFYLKWHLRTGNLVYRFRTAETVTPWKELSQNDNIDWNDDVLITRYPIERPSSPCDMEFYTYVNDYFPYYSYVDYSGLGIGCPFREETGVVTNRSTSVDTLRANMGSEHYFVRIREFKSRFKRLLLSKHADSVPLIVQAPSSYFTGAILGFRVTSIAYDTTGVSVSFETDLPPPYEIGIYRMMEIGLGRHKALAKCVTYEKRATVLGDFTDTHVFVQVGQEGALGVDSVIPRSTYRNYADWVKRLPQMTDERQSTIVRKNSRFVQSADGEWSAFFPCSTNVVTFSVDGEYMMPGATHHADAFRLTCHSDSLGSFTVQPYADRAPVTELSYHPVLTSLTNWVVRPVSVTEPQTVSLPLDILSVGSGYRVIVNEVSNTVDLVRAYSARTNISDAVLIPRAFRALSTENGYKYTTDWLGTREMKKETNYVDNVIYPRGL